MLQGFHSPQVVSHPDALGDRSIVELICMSPLVVLVIHCIVLFRIGVIAPPTFTPPFSVHSTEHAQFVAVRSIG